VTLWAWWRQCLLIAAAATAVGAAAAAQATDPAPMAGPARCRFVAPEGMPAADIRWSGSCRSGLAHGRGTLRAFEGGKVVQVFYGRLEAGQPRLGAIDLGGGFKAGRFEAGRPVADGDRDTLIKAFDEAAAAARQVSAAYRRAGNVASARFYRDKAQQLAQQLD
jgi:hypothetical protein